MKIHGYCTSCRRIKRVQVKVLGPGVQHGICDDCADTRKTTED